MTPYSDAMTVGSVFPSINARNLEGLDVRLPAAFAGERNVVLIAFQRNHQSLVDSWLPWLEKQCAADPGLRFYEVPTIGRIWAPARRFIDGGMAASIKVPEILQRTFTVYGDISRLTGPLSIHHRSTIAVLLVDGNGHVLWQGSGGYSTSAAESLESVISAHRQ